MNSDEKRKKKISNIVKGFSETFSFDERRNQESIENAIRGLVTDMLENGISENWVRAHIENILSEVLNENDEEG